MSTQPRDVLADRIATWVDDDADLYDFADRLIRDLFDAGFVIEEQVRDVEGLLVRTRPVNVTVCSHCGGHGIELLGSAR